MSWKEDLENKAKQMNIKKEEEDGQVIPYSVVPDGNNSGSSRNVHRISVYKKIINKDERRNKLMISVEDALKDLDGISEGKYQGKVLATDSDKIIAVVKVVMKFLSTMRSNQLLTDEDKKRIKEEREKRKETKK